MSHTTTGAHGSCQWFDRVDGVRDVVCAADARHRVKVIGCVTRAVVLLCGEHKTHVNREFAARRHASASVAEGGRR